jgi:RNA polymerase sigma-70 factor, ECF subfamily
MSLIERRQKTENVTTVSGFTEIYDQYAPRFIGLCYRYCGNYEDAEDIMHDGFLNIMRNFKKFQHRGDGSLEAWMKKIMVNTALKFIQRSSKYDKLLVFDISEGERNLPDEPVTSSYPEVSKEFLLKLITELPLGYRMVFNFHVMENYSHKEIANLLHCSENTSKSQLSKARAWLQKRILESKKHNENERKTISYR